MTLQVPTIDVETQEPGPRMSLGQLADYFAQPPDKRGRLVNVVSCSLAGTALEVGGGPLDAGGSCEP